MVAAPVAGGLVRSGRTELARPTVPDHRRGVEPRRPASSASGFDPPDSIREDLPAHVGARRGRQLVEPLSMLSMGLTCTAIRGPRDSRDDGFLGAREEAMKKSRIRGEDPAGDPKNAHRQVTTAGRVKGHPSFSIQLRSGIPEWRSSMVCESPIPILRIFDEAIAKAFYVEYLGFTGQRWSPHRFGAASPLQARAGRIPRVISRCAGHRPPI
jgi:hypothetical protein